jgi:hypothetical protein
MSDHTNDPRSVSGIDRRSFLRSGEGARRLARTSSRRARRLT